MDPARAEAKGPFPGQHGGAVAGVMAAAIEQHAAGRDFGIGLKFSLHLLRPVPIAPVRVTIREEHTGSRLSVLGAEMTIEDKRYAFAHAVFVRTAATPGLTGASHAPQDPTRLPAYRISSYSGEPWFWDTLECRRDTRAGVFWVRQLMPVADPLTALAQVAALADWSSGLSRPDSLERPLVDAFPNADLSVHLSRAPRGDWIGLRGNPAWNANGTGLTDTELLDAHGAIGRCCQSIVLVPRQTA